MPMKPFKNLTVLLSAALLSCIFLSQCQSQEASELSSAQWLFMDKNTPLYAEYWVGEGHHINAMNGSQARIEAVRTSAKEQTPFSYSIVDGTPYVGTLTQDDYILFRVPAGNMGKGSHVEVDAVLVSNPSSPKYFIIEYQEGGEWKSLGEDVYPVPENPDMKYSFICSGLGQGEPHEYTSVYQTITLDSNVKDGELLIRFRAVGEYTCSGEPNDPSADDGSIGFATFGYTGAYIADYGTSVPTDTTDILCLGNSFTYFSNAPSMIKEIAWSQGHYFNVKASLKGGQTLGQHTTRVLTRHLAGYGEYDYVFFQDQSQNPARYASDPKGYAPVAEDYMKLSGLVQSYSPECKIIMEQTWAYPAFRFGGFGDFDTFTNLLKEGAEKMAAQNGGLVSPIGEAYRIIWNESPEISLYDSDAKHQSHYGSYLKACVNYLMITGEPFHGTPADCSLEPSKAATIRAAAERAVLGR